MAITKFVLSTLLLLIVPLGSVHSAERPTLNHTCDPRPDILPHPFYYAHTEYRREYNRPRDLSGWIAHKIAPSSQEAMVWCENVQAGNYDQKHMPPMYKSYYYPKPWEVLQTGARPDYAKTTAASSRRSPVAQPSSADDASEPERPSGTEAASDSATGGDEPARVPPVPVPPNAFR